MSIDKLESDLEMAKDDILDDESDEFLKKNYSIFLIITYN